jgi:2-octaprenyl-6-methoxyphenol hydroxylase
VNPVVNPVDHHDFDIAILGGGLVGSSLACALDGRGWRVALVEGAPPRQAPPGFDDRRLALAAASLNALQALDVLTRLPAPASPIRRLHVSRQGDFGAVRLQAADSGRDAFGAVITANALGAALESRLASVRGLQVLRPRTLVRMEGADAGWRLHLDGHDGAEVISARLVIGADGTRSFVRDALGIGTDEHDYHQVLVVCGVACDRAADGTAYERFSAQGPVAMLPMGRDYGSICGVAAADAARVRALDDIAYIDYLQQRFGWRAGRILRAGKRSAYPLVRVVAQALQGPRALLMGNAAQTIHPIGAQGFNLGLRDALTFAELLVEGGDPGDPALLSAYVDARREDRERTLAFSDGLARATANDSSAMQVLRSLGLLALANLPGLSAPLVSGAMGFRGRVPRLSRGLP